MALRSRLPSSITVEWNALYASHDGSAFSSPVGGQRPIPISSTSPHSIGHVCSATSCVGPGNVLSELGNQSTTRTHAVPHLHSSSDRAIPIVGVSPSKRKQQRAGLSGCPSGHCAHRHARSRS